MRTVSVVVIHELLEDRDEVTAAEDDHPIQALSADNAGESLSDGVGSRRPGPGVRITCIPSDRKTSSRLVVNLVSRK
jgi:hypothetical protein